MGTKHFPTSFNLFHRAVRKTYLRLYWNMRPVIAALAFLCMTTSSVTARYLRVRILMLRFHDIEAL